VSFSLYLIYTVIHPSIYLSIYLFADLLIHTHCQFECEILHRQLNSLKVHGISIFSFIVRFYLFCCTVHVTYHHIFPNYELITSKKWQWKPWTLPWTLAVYFVGFISFKFFAYLNIQTITVLLALLSLGLVTFIYCSLRR
jgi:hypothetical protein